MIKIYYGLNIFDILLFGSFEEKYISNIKQNQYYVQRLEQVKTDISAGNITESNVVSALETSVSTNDNTTN